jgi:hypothetical protein
MQRQRLAFMPTAQQVFGLEEKAAYFDTTKSVLPLTSTAETVAT